MWECIYGVGLELYIRIVSKQIGQDWKKLARTFKFTKTDIDAIQHNNMGNLEEQIAQVFIKWKMQYGSEAKPQALVDAVIEAELTGVIHALKQAELLQRKGLDSVTPESQRGPIKKSQPCSPEIQPGSIEEPYPGPIQESRPDLIQPLQPSAIQESQLSSGPYKPKLIGFAASVESELDSEVDKLEPVVHKPSPSSLRDSPLSRDEIRIKRLIKREYEKTGRGLFEVNSMVKVEAYGYGVVKCIHDFPVEGLMAGIEFEKPIEGSVEFKDVSFDCEEGFGQFVPYNELEVDERFQQPEPSFRDQTDAVISESCDIKQSESPQSLSMRSRTSEQEFEKLLDILNPSVADSSAVCKLPYCSKPRNINELGKVHDYCSKSHAVIHAQGNCASFIAEGSDKSITSSYTFRIAEDCVGMVIGKDGKNISKVEKATNTSIKIFGDKCEGIIIGSQENCKKAAFMIANKLNQKILMHTATSKTIPVPHNMVRRIIGKNGVTIEAIKSLSGAHDIDFSEKPIGLEAFLNPVCTCTITGSDEQIEKAKELIEQVTSGTDIATNAEIAAMCVRLGLSLNNDACVIS